MIFHGAGASADARPKSEFEFDEIWNEPSSDLPADMIVAAPQAAIDSWIADPYGADAEFATVVLDDVEERLCVDPARIYATGISSGGVLVSTLTCRLSDRLAAVGTTIGMVDPFDRCQGEPAPVPIVSINGDQDRTFQVDKIASAHERWGRHNGCESQASDLLEDADVTLTEFAGCADGATVALYIVHGMSHQQARSDCTNVPPSIRERVCFVSELDFRSVQMEFFASHQRATRDQE